jgi:hypothetical protein
MRGAAFLVLCLLASSPAPARESAPLTVSELAKLSDGQVARRIFGPLAPDLFVSIRPGTATARWRGERIWFWTRPREDRSNPGLCRTDRMIVSLEPVGTKPTGDRLVRLASIETRTYFIVRNPALAERGSGTPKELEGLEAACAALDPRRDSIPADSGWQLMKALSLANELGAAARAGRAPVPIDCTRLRFSGPPPRDEAECLKEISGLSERLVAGVRSCGERPALDGSCISVQAANRFISFVLDHDRKMVRVSIEGMEDLSSSE